MHRTPGPWQDCATAAMMHLCFAAGLRVSELTGLTLDSLSGPQLETVRVMGKGRRERETAALEGNADRPERMARCPACGQQPATCS